MASFTTDLETTENIIELHQALMDEAYAWWQKQENCKTEDFYTHMKENMTQKHLDAVVLGNLNYQVCNGGWNQWVGNGYAINAWEPLKDVLTRMGTTIANKTLGMLKDLEPHLDFDQGNTGWGEYFLGDREEECGWCDNGTTEGDYNEETGEYEEEECRDCNGSGYIEVKYLEGESIARGNDNPFYKFNDELMAEVEDFLNDRPLKKARKAAPKDKNPEMGKSNVKYPEAKVKLTGSDGNALSIVGNVSRALRKAHVSSEEIAKYRDESMSGDYNHVLVTAMRWVEVA